MVGTWRPAKVNPLHLSVKKTRNTQCEGKVECQKPISLQDRAQEGTKRHRACVHAAGAPDTWTQAWTTGPQGVAKKDKEKQLHVEGQEDTVLCPKQEHGIRDSHLFKDMSSHS